MSYFLKNLNRVARELAQTPILEMPETLAGFAKPKIEKALEEGLYRTGLMTLLSRRFKGPGVALMFHEIQTSAESELFTGCPPEQLRTIIQEVRGTGRDIVTVDEGLSRLQEPGSRPFALLTFDDGYRDNLSNALPVLEELNAPMTLFVPTGMMSREMNVWWLVLREILKTHDVLEVPPMGRTFQCADLPGKSGALRQITGWIGTDQSRVEEINSVLAPFELEEANLIDRFAMDEAHLKSFAAHPLVTIGAHTQSHRFLSQMSGAEVLNEFEQNKAYLEQLLGKRIDYLAYPYGTVGACGEREAELAREAGFKAAFTTRPGHLFAEHLCAPHLLPRIDVGYYPQRRSALASRLSGYQRAALTGWKEPVALLR